MDLLAPVAWQGISRTRDLVGAPGGGPSTPTELAIWTFNQATGSMSESVLGNNGTVIGNIERQVNEGGNGISTGSSNAAAGDGTNGQVVVSHISQYQTRADQTAIINFSISGFMQSDTTTGSGVNRPFFSKDAFGLPGGLSVEAYNDGSNDKIRAYLRDDNGSAKWADGDDGDDPTAGVNITVDQAYKWVVTYDGTTFKLWVYDETPSQVGTISVTVSSPGLSLNTTDISMFAYNGGVSFYDGLLDDVILWDGDLNQSEIEAIDDARTIDHGDPPSPPNDGFPLLEPGADPGTLYTGYRNLGDIGEDNLINLDQGTSSTRVLYDLRGTGKEIDLTNPPSNLTWDGKRCIYRCDGNNGGTNHASMYVAGGWIHCTNMLPTYEWGSLYQTSNNPRSSVFARESSNPDAVFDGFRAHAAGWDAYATGSGTTNSWPRTKIRRWIVTGQRDDGNEDDNRCVDFTIEDSYIQAFSCFSSNNSGANFNSRTAFISNCLFELYPGTLNGTFLAGPFFKLDARAVRFNCQNSAFAVPDPGVVGSYSVDSRSIFRDLITYNKLHPSSANCEIYWLGDGAFPYENPDASVFTVLTGTAADDAYAAKLAAIWATFPGHRFDFDPGGPFDPGAGL